jgi:acarbose 7IV-phosphotransferase
MVAKAVVLGGVAWNTMVRLAAFPDPVPQTVFARGGHEAVGSSGAGKALNLRRLGFDVSLWAAIGDDDAGRRIRSALMAEGIGFFGQLDPAGTMRHVNLMDDAGDRISIFVNAGSATLEVDLGFLDPWLADADVVWTTIFDPCRVFLPAIAAAGKARWVDVHDYDGTAPYHQQFVEAADMLFVSSARLADHRRFMRERVDAGARVVVCTHGPAGAIALGRDEGWVEVPAAPAGSVVDTNGAGDAFSSGFAAAWVRGLGLEVAMHAGALMGAAAVTSPELAPSAVPEELVALLS